MFSVCVISRDAPEIVFFDYIVSLSASDGSLSPTCSWSLHSQEVTSNIRDMMMSFLLY